MEDQAIARAHRMGQTRPVVAVRYIMNNSIEEACEESLPEHRAEDL